MDEALEVEVESELDAPCVDPDAIELLESWVELSAVDVSSPDEASTLSTPLDGRLSVDVDEVPVVVDEG